MIAFIKYDAPPRSPPSLRRARRLVASTLLRRKRRSTDHGPGVPVWLAWTFTGWIVGVTLIYGLTMLGWL